MKEIALINPADGSRLYFPLPDSLMEIPLEKGLILRDAVDSNQAGFLSTDDVEHRKALIDIAFSFWPEWKDLNISLDEDVFAEIVYHVVGLLSEYKAPVNCPSRYTFEHAGRRWFLDDFIPEVLTGRLSATKLSVWAATRALEAERLWELQTDMSRATSLDKHTTIATQLAAILECDQPWPDSVAGKERELLDRMKMLEDIPTSVALDILSFFFAWKRGIEQDGRFYFVWNPPHRITDEKQAREAGERFDRLGFSFIPVTVMGQTKSPFSQVMAMPMEEALYLVNQYNSSL